jgi:hypothetical protein
MAEKWEAAILADVSAKDLSKGGKVWDSTLVGGRKFKTFSKTAGPVLEKNVGKTVVAEVEVSGQFRGEDEYKLLTLWDGEGTLLYEPSADEKKGGGSRGGGGGRAAGPEWASKTPEERWHERVSYEAQHSATVAGELAGRLFGQGESSEALDFVVGAIPRIAAATREAAVSFTLPASYAARMPKTSGAGAETPKSSPRGSGPAPAKAPDTLSDAYQQKLDIALAAYESKSKLLARYNRTHGDEHGKATTVEGIPEAALDLMINEAEGEEKAS